MDTINPGMIVFLAMFSLLASMAAGAYARYLFRNFSFVHSGLFTAIQAGVLFLLFTLTLSFAAAGTIPQMFGFFVLFEGVLASMLIGPSWDRTE